MNHKTTILTGVVFAGLAVMIGAFGAHGLKALLDANERAETFELAVRYQFYHALALILTGIISGMNDKVRSLRLTPFLFVAGIILFSGSLFILSLTNRTWLGAVTPFGGLSFLGGWALLFFGVRNAFK